MRKMIVRRDGECRRYGVMFRKNGQFLSERRLACRRFGTLFQENKEFQL